nr:unnamed protein product [Spirometra erinaceieuropaei]
MAAEAHVGQTPRLPKDNAVPDIAFVVSPNLGSVVTRGDAQDAKLSSTSESSSGNISTAATDPTPVPTAKPSEDSNNLNAGQIAGIVIGILIGVLLIILVIVLVSKKNKDDWNTESLDWGSEDDAQQEGKALRTSPTTDTLHYF